MNSLGKSSLVYQGLFFFVAILGLQPRDKAARRDKAAMLAVKTINQWRIYTKMELSSQRRAMFLLLTSNMAAVTSSANQQCLD